MAEPSPTTKVTSPKNLNLGAFGGIVTIESPFLEE